MHDLLAIDSAAAGTVETIRVRSDFGQHVIHRVRHFDGGMYALMKKPEPVPGLLRHVTEFLAASFMRPVFFDQMAQGTRWKLLQNDSVIIFKICQRPNRCEVCIIICDSLIDEAHCVVLIRNIDMDVVSLYGLCQRIHFRITAYLYQDGFILI